MKRVIQAVTVMGILGLSGAAFAQGGGGGGGGNSPGAASGQGASSSPSSANPGATANDTKMKDGGKGTATSSGTMAPDKAKK